MVRRYVDSLFGYRDLINPLEDVPSEPIKVERYFSL